MDEDIKQEEIQEEDQEAEKGEVQEKEEKTAEGDKEKPLDKMTAKELREMALEIPGITGAHAMKKEELLAAIKEAKGIVDEGPEKKKRKKAATKEYSIGELKSKIGQLMDEKKNLPPETDRKKRTILRRRVNRLKKQTRKVA